MLHIILQKLPLNMYGNWSSAYFCRNFQGKLKQLAINLLCTYCVFAVKGALVGGQFFVVRVLGKISPFLTPLFPKNQSKHKKEEKINLLITSLMPLRSQFRTVELLQCPLNILLSCRASGMSSLYGASLLHTSYGSFLSGSVSVVGAIPDTALKTSFHSRSPGNRTRLFEPMLQRLLPSKCQLQMALLISQYFMIYNGYIIVYYRD